MAIGESRSIIYHSVLTSDNMNPIDERILKFINEHHVLTLAVTNQNRPWCASCFYVYIPEKNLFIFTSDPDTQHIRDVIQSSNYHVAGTIALETKITGKIRGIQFSGSMRELSGEELRSGKKTYYEKFPIARLSKLYLWGIEPGFIKMTDNRLGFGKKLIWHE
jgi:uncharacterized protein YhbP (UPF0306 family)